MEIAFEFDMNDWMEFQKLHFQKSKTFNRSLFISRLILPLFFILIIVIKGAKGTLHIYEPIIFAIIAALWIIFYPKRVIKKALRNTKRTLENGDNNGLIGMHKYAFTENDIIVNTPEAESTMEWRAIKKLEETATHYFLFTTTVSAIAICKQKIPDQEAALGELLKSKIKEQYFTVIKKDFNLKIY